MAEALAAARLYLKSIWIGLPWLLLTVGIFGTVYGSRKHTPQVWVWFDSVSPDGNLRHLVQGLPSVAAGAFLGALLTNDWAEYRGILSGAAAPLAHLILKALPISYQGAVRTVVKRVGIIALVLYLSACSALKTANDARIALCDLLGEEHEAQLAAEAKRVGMTPAALLALWKTQCLIRVAAAEQESIGAISGAGENP